MSTTVAELYSFMKCFGTCQFLRGLWMDMTSQKAEIHMRTDAKNLVATAQTTALPEQKETIHMINMLRTEACSGQIDDLAHVSSEDCLADCFAKEMHAKVLIQSVKDSWLPNVDANPEFRQLIQQKHKAYFIQWLLETLDPSVVMNGSTFWGYEYIEEALCAVNSRNSKSYHPRLQGLK